MHVGEAPFTGARESARGPASPGTAPAWIERARERTIKHLREEVRLTELKMRMTGARLQPPPSVDEVREFHEIEARVKSGELWRSGELMAELGLEGGPLPTWIWHGGRMCADGGGRDDDDAGNGRAQRLDEVAGTAASDSADAHATGAPTVEVAAAAAGDSADAHATAAPTAEVAETTASDAGDAHEMAGPTDETADAALGEGNAANRGRETDGDTEGRMSARRDDDASHREGVTEEDAEGRMSARRDDDASHGERVSAGDERAAPEHTDSRASASQPWRPEGPLDLRLVANDVGIGMVTYRFRVRAEVAEAYRAAERAYLRHRTRPESFIVFITRCMWETHAHALESTAAYSDVYDRDRWTCASPVCNRCDCTPHHVVFRSRGGGEDRGNIVTLCVWCHLLGVHEGRVRVTGEAPFELEWLYGRTPVLSVNGRTKTELQVA